MLADRSSGGRPAGTIRVNLLRRPFDEQPRGGSPLNGPISRLSLHFAPPNAKGRHDKVGVTAAPMGRLFLGRPRVRSGGWDLGNLSRSLSVLTIA
jgi:hypothetical protein